VPSPFYAIDFGSRSSFKFIVSRQWDAAEYLGVYLDALDDELLALLTSISTPKPAFTALRRNAKKGSVGRGPVDVCADPTKSPISRIFDGKLRKTVHMTGQDDIVRVESWRTL